jgi:hypothetical protein
VGAPNNCVRAKMETRENMSCGLTFFWRKLIRLIEAASTGRSQSQSSCQLAHTLPGLIRRCVTAAQFWDGLCPMPVRCGDTR